MTAGFFADRVENLRAVRSFLSDPQRVYGVTEMREGFGFDGFLVSSLCEPSLLPNGRTVAKLLSELALIYPLTPQFDRRKLWRSCGPRRKLALRRKDEHGRRL